MTLEEFLGEYHKALPNYNRSPAVNLRFWPKDNREMPCRDLCPVTLVCYEKTGRHLGVDYRRAALLIGLNQEEADMIAKASDSLNFYPTLRSKLESGN